MYGVGAPTDQYGAPLRYTLGPGGQGVYNPAAPSAGSRAAGYPPSAYQAPDAFGSRQYAPALVSGGAPARQGAPSYVHAPDGGDRRMRSTSMPRTSAHGAGSALSRTQPPYVYRDQEVDVDSYADLLSQGAPGRLSQYEAPPTNPRAGLGAQDQGHGYVQGLVDQAQGYVQGPGGVAPLACSVPVVRESRLRHDSTDELARSIDANGDGAISKLELIQAAQRDPNFAIKVLPKSLSHEMKLDADGVYSISETVFDVIDETFDEIAQGKQHIKCAEFAEYIRKKEESDRTKSHQTIQLRQYFDLMDADGNNAVSKWELFEAVRTDTSLADFLLPGLDCRRAMQDESTFDAVNCVFQSIAGGKKRFAYSDFEWHYRTAETKSLKLRERTQTQEIDAVEMRRQTRILVIGPGYGRALNPPQANSLTDAGFQVRFIDNLPNPEHDQFPVQPYLQMIRQEIEAFNPHIMSAASKGGIYLVRLWQAGLWTGPSVLINAHPTCIQLPRNCPVVVCSGDQDEVYRVQRDKVEEVMATGAPNMTFLFWIGSSGYLPQGIRSREGDTHNMVSLTQNDCLPRLMDAVMDADGPEVHMIRTWRERLSRERLQAEGLLGYTPQQLQKRWQSQSQRGLEDRKLWDVPRGGDEYRCVETIFKARPRDTAAYNTGPQANWDRRPIVAVQRIENGLQINGSVVPYYNALRHSFEDQGVSFEPGVHTIWTWHGADAAALDSIINDPMQGMRPLAVGTKGASLWGKGTYLARDAKYVGEAGFCGQRSPDGTSRMLLCLDMIGIPCAGDPNHNGLLPYRRKPHRYHSSVDHLSTPEVFIAQQGGAVLPAYVVTFQ